MDTRWEMGTRKQGVTPELDALSGDLLSVALDRLADGMDLNVLIVVEDARSHVVSYEIADDGAEQLIEGAYQRVRDLARNHGDREAGLSDPVRYAMVYEGAVDIDGRFEDAVILEFGERGWQSFSAYLLYRGKGRGDAFTWTDPAPAGEVECLL